MDIMCLMHHLDFIIIFLKKLIYIDQITKISLHCLLRYHEQECFVVLFGLVLFFLICLVHFCLFFFDFWFKCEDEKISHYNSYNFFFRFFFYLIFLFYYIFFMFYIVCFLSLFLFYFFIFFIVFFCFWLFFLPVSIFSNSSNVLR